MEHLLGVSADVELGLRRSTAADIQPRDGPVLSLKKLDESHDRSDRVNALTALEHSEAEGRISTGLL